MRVYGDFDRGTEINTALITAGVAVGGMRMSEENLEDHFVKLTGGSDVTEPVAAEESGRRRGRRR